MPIADRSCAAGQVLGAYELLEEVGRGGLGVVYRSRHRQRGCEVALKVLHAHWAGSPEFVERFRDEGRLMALLEHPHVLQVCDAGEVDGVFFLATHYLPGRTLQELITAPLRLVRAVSIARQLGDALGCAHRQGVIHRDVKPANVMVEPGDHVTLMDFGVARLKDAPGMTLPGIRIGTPYYMAPEQIAGKPSDHRADLYSLGVVLYTMLAGRLPFPGPSTEEVYTGHVQMPPPPLADAHPAWIRNVVARALEKDPAARYQSADEFLRDLDDTSTGPVIHDRLHLHVTSGHTRRQFELARDLVIGRADPAARTVPDVELRFDHAVSRQHARIFQREGAFYLEDLGSANGTSINGRWLCPRHPVALMAGDLITLGERTLIRVRTPLTGC